MAKQKIKNLKRLSEDEVTKIIHERLDFDILIHLETGYVVDPDSMMAMSDDGDSFPVKRDECVNAIFNDSVYDRIIKNIRRIVMSRGIKDPRNVDEKDYDVRRLYDAWVSRQPRPHNRQERDALKDLSTRKLSSIVQQVVSLHEPHYMIASFQVIAWAITSDDLLVLEQDGTTSKIDCRLDVEIPDDYWGIEFVDNKKILSQDDILDSMMDNVVPPSPLIDRTIPLEILIAFVSTILNKYESFSNTLKDFVSIVFAAISIRNSDEQFDDAGFLRERLDDVLRGIMGESDIVVNGGVVVSRIQEDAEEVGDKSQS